MHALRYGEDKLLNEARYEHDSLGRRTHKQVEIEGTLTTTQFLWQGLRLLQETCGGRQQLYIYEPDSYAPLARVDRTEAGKPSLYYLHTDQIGTPLEVTSAQGDLVWQARYKAWGEVERFEVQSIEQPLRFQGQYFDAETGLHYNTFRYYDPGVGRFTTQDPIGLLGGDNLYQYAVNPTGWVDPLGLNAKPSLPKRTIASSGNTSIVHYYDDLVKEHADPIHFHIEEDGKSIGKVKADGTVLHGKPNKNSAGMLKDRSVIGTMRKAEKRIANYIRKVGGGIVGGRPFRPGARGAKIGCV